MKTGTLRVGVGEVVLAGTFTIGSLLTWYGAHGLTVNQGRSPWPVAIGLLAAGIAICAAAVVEGTSRRAMRVAALLGFGSAIPLAFRQGLSLGVPAVLFALLLLELSMWRARRARAALRVPSIMFTARRALPTYFSAVSIVLTAIVFLSPVAANVIANPVPDSVVRFAVRIADPLLQPVLGFSLNGTINDVLRQSIESANPGVEIDSRVIDLQREQYAERYGIALTSQDTIADMLIKLIDRQTRRFAERLDSYARIGFFIAAFVLFQLLAFPFTWVMIGMTAGILWLFRFSGAVVLVTRTEPRTALHWRNLEASDAPFDHAQDQPPSSTASSSGQQQTIQ